MVMENSVFCHSNRRNKAGASQGGLMVMYQYDGTTFKERLSILWKDPQKNAQQTLQDKTAGI